MSAVSLKCGWGCNWEGWTGAAITGERKTARHKVQWNLSIKDTPNKGHLSNENTVCSPNHKELCTNLPLNWDTSLYRTPSWVPMVSTMERLHCRY